MTKKYTWKELFTLMCDFNQNHKDESILKAVIVFKPESFTRPYTEQERSYIITSDNKGFNSGCCGNSIFGSCLDDKDMNVRLDFYVHTWQVDYCYLVD